MESLNQKYRCLYRVGIETGFRISDILRLKLSDIKGRKISLKEKKTGKVREVRISKKLQEEIKMYAKAYKIGESEQLFGISRQAVWKAFKVSAKKNDVKVNVGCHSMRKKYARKIYDKHKSLREVKEKMGHENENVTAVYLIDGG